MAPLQHVHMAPEALYERQKWYGRLYAPDYRDSKFPMTRALDAMRGVRGALKRRTQAPQRGPTLDQGPTSMCVMYSAATALAAAPIGYTRSPILSLSRVQVLTADPSTDGYFDDLYQWAQANDEWPGEDYDGTSVRAGQEYLRLIGRSKGYVWATSPEEAKDYISRMGSAPIILGVDWTETMDVPKKIGSHYYIEPTGAVLGGHAICCLWYSKTLRAWKLQNSWGEDWADKGIVYLPDEAFDYLVFGANGEAASFTEMPL